MFVGNLGNKHLLHLLVHFCIYAVILGQQNLSLTTEKVRSQPGWPTSLCNLGIQSGVITLVTPVVVKYYYHPLLLCTKCYESSLNYEKTFSNLILLCKNYTPLATSYRLLHEPICQALSNGQKIILLEG